MKNVVESMPLFLNARQLAGCLGLSVGQIRALAKSGRIPEIRIGKNTRRYNLEAVTAALLQNGTTEAGSNNL